MNKQDIQSSVYAQKVDLLLRLLPLVMEEKVFAVHGGTAINLFLRNLPRYSVDIDLTYIPLADRKKSIDDINFHLKSISEKARKAFPGMHIIPNYAIFHYAKRLRMSSKYIVSLTLFLFHYSMEVRLQLHSHVNIHETYSM